MRNIPKSTKLLIALEEIADTLSDTLGAFLLSAGSVSQLRKNLKMQNSEYKSALQGLARHGYIRRVNENQFLITPKARRKIKISKIENSEWEKTDWDGFWRIVSFDIPETKKAERNIFRSVIKRKGFIGIQNSVFVAPFADFEALAELRENLRIEEYVSFFVAQSYKTDDDTELKNKFNL